MFRVMLWLALGWAAQVAVQKTWLAINLPDPGGIVSELIFYGVMFAVVANRARRYSGAAWSTLIPLRGVSLGVVPAILLTTVAGLVLSYQCITFSNALMPIHIVDPAIPSTSEPAWTGHFAILLLCNAALPAIFEEAMLRGLVLHALAENMSRRRAIVISSALFAVMHGAIERTPGTFLLGLVYGWMYVQTGSLIPGMFAHALHNTLVETLDRANAFQADSKLGFGVDAFGLLPAWATWMAIAAVITGAMLIRKTSVWPEDPGWSEAEELAEREQHDRAA